MKKVIILLVAMGSLGFSLLDLKQNSMKNINAFLQGQVDKGQTPSIQYAFFDADSLIYEFRSGLKNVKAHQPVDTGTTYHLYSITKTFTALAVLQLAQAGKIDLNHPVNAYLPAFPYDKEITIEQLLSHTAGIPNPIPLKWIHLEAEHGTFKRDQFFAEVFKAHPTLDFKPGTGFKYSNLGYVILGQLVEKVSGLAFEDYVQENIIEHSGASQELGFWMDPERHAVGYHKWWSLTNAALGFLIDKDKFMGPREDGWKPFHRFYNNGIAYGGMVGTASGLVAYAQTLMQDNSVLLAEAYKQKLFAEQVIAGKPTGMSLSWFTGTLNGNQYVAHTGGGGGYYVEIRIYPELKVGSVIMYNRSGMTDERILDQADRFFITEKTAPVISARR